MKRPLNSTPILELGAAFSLGIGGILRQPRIPSGGTKRRAPAFQGFTGSTDQGR